jgi:RNA polymerase sigma factor (TIGR02999 family)
VQQESNFLEYSRSAKCNRPVEGIDSYGYSGKEFESAHFTQMTSPAKEITEMLIHWSNGHQEVLSELMPLVYDELRRLAAHYLGRERPDHTLQPTALVHEAYLRLVDQSGVRWQNRAHFFGIAAKLMRQILVNHALAHRAAKRGGTAFKLTLDEAVDVCGERSFYLVALDEALARLAALDPQQGRIVELRFFGGLTIEEVAEVLRVSPATVEREWITAKAWLHCTLTKTVGTQE